MPQGELPRASSGLTQPQPRDAVSAQSVGSSSHSLVVVSFSFSVPDRTRAFCMFDVAKTRDLTSKSMTLKLYHVTNMFLFRSYSYFSIEDLERMISCGD
jgi:hypothetical protein